MNRDDFPALKDVVYFDNAATSLKPECVIDKMNEYYSKYSSNIHRGDYSFANRTNKEYDGARVIVKDFLNAKSEKEIVFTSGSTMALNMIAFGFVKNKLKEGDEVLLNKGEHASLVLPYLVLQKEIGIKVKFASLDKNYELSCDSIVNNITPKTKVVALSYITNVIGDVRDVKKICEICHSKGIYVIVDASQAVSHIPVDVQDLDADFLAFSGHKMLGPTGIGVLYGKYDLLNDLKPIMYGGGMNQFFEEDGSYDLKSIPTRLEAGTPPIAEAIGLGEACKYLMRIGVNNIHKHEMELKKYLVDNIKGLDNIILYNEDLNSGTLVFNVSGVFSQDAAIYLSHFNICVRAGNHCTKMLKDEIKIKNTVRVSMHMYNNKEDCDKLIEALKNSKDIFKVIL